MSIMSFNNHESHLKGYLKHHRDARNTRFKNAQAEHVPTSKSSEGIGPFMRQDKSPATKSRSEKSKPSSQTSPCLKVNLEEESHGKEVSDKNSMKAVKTKTVNTKRKFVPKAPSVKQTKPSMNNLPEELLFKIFCFLGPGELLLCSLVCHRWKAVSSDNVIWQVMYDKYAPKGRPNTKPVKHPKNPVDGYWKKECIKQSIKERDLKALGMLRKPDPYTGLPAKTQESIKFIGIQWQLSFIDRNDTSYTHNHRDSYAFKMSTCVRWFDLTFPPVSSLSRLHISAACPVFYERDGTVAKGSTHQKSLLYDFDFDWNKTISKIPTASSNDKIDVRVLGPLIIATWKDGGELAFISAFLHLHGLVQNCLQYVGVMRSLQPKGKVPTHYGHTVTLELHNQRTSIWQTQSRSIYFTDHDLMSGSAEINIISPEESSQHTPFTQKLHMPWKTDIFKSIIQDLCVLDITMLNDKSEPVWCKSEVVVVKRPDLNTTTYDYDGNYHQIDYEDDVGSVNMRMVWEEDIGHYMVNCLQVKVSLPAIGYSASL